MGRWRWRCCRGAQGITTVQSSVWSGTTSPVLGTKASRRHSVLPRLGVGRTAEANATRSRPASSAKASVARPPLGPRSRTDWQLWV
jgi:hypothetical protein